MKRGYAPFGRDIAIILIAKFAALALLYFLFFSDPVRATGKAMFEHIFGG